MALKGVSYCAACEGGFLLSELREQIYEGAIRRFRRYLDYEDRVYRRLAVSRVLRPLRFVDPYSDTASRVSVDSAGCRSVGCLTRILSLRSPDSRTSSIGTGMSLRVRLGASARFIAS